jgi:hypothetical protein
MSLKEKYAGKLIANEDKEMKISKEDFINLLTKMKERDERLSKVSDGLEQLIDGYACINVNEDVDSAILNLLIKLTGDSEDTISWWLYENVEKVITITNKSSINPGKEDVFVKLETVEDLYDYLHYFS